MNNKRHMREVKRIMLSGINYASKKGIVKEFGNDTFKFKRISLKKMFKILGQEFMPYFFMALYDFKNDVEGK